MLWVRETTIKSLKKKTAMGGINLSQQIDWNWVTIVRIVFACCFLLLGKDLFIIALHLTFISPPRQRRL